MPKTRLEPDSHLKVRYRVPRHKMIEYFVESLDGPVDTFVLDDKGLEQFLSKRTKEITSYYGGFTNRYVHQQKLRLPIDGPWWYLLIYNPNKQSVTIEYDVFASRHSLASGG